MLTTTQQSDIALRASEELANSSVGELRHLRVDGSAESLELTGQVRSYYHKQLAQETVRTVADGMQVINHVNVCS